LKVSLSDLKQNFQNSNYNNPKRRGAFFMEKGISRQGLYYARMETVSRSGTATMLHYLLDDKHANHLNKTSKIIGVSNNHLKFRFQTIKRVRENQKRYKASGGTKLMYSCNSIMFSLPKRYNVTEKDMTMITGLFYERVKKAYAKYDSSKSEIFCNIHLQKSGTHHCNILAPRLGANSKQIPTVTTKAFYFNTLGKLWTKTIDEVLGTNVEEYKSDAELKELERLRKIEKEHIELKQEHSKLRKANKKLIQKANSDSEIYSAWKKSSYKNIKSMKEKIQELKDLKKDLIAEIDDKNHLKDILKNEYDVVIKKCRNLRKIEDSGKISENQIKSMRNEIFDKVEKLNDYIDEKKEDKKIKPKNMI
jgi:hypothetical protein